MPTNERVRALFRSLSADLASTEVFPVFPTVCVECSFTRFYSALLAGVVLAGKDPELDAAKAEESETASKPEPEASASTSE